jgi:hypothetical protein
VCIPDLPGAEPRLQRRYHHLVVGHLRQADRVSAGLRAPPGVAEQFSAAQAAWRFYANPRVTLRQLAGPLEACGRAGVAGSCDGYALVVADWCQLHYGGHASKADRVGLAHDKDLGYELLTALAVSDRDGSPIAPLCLDLRAEGGVYTTRSGAPLPPPSQLDGLGPVMAHVESLGLARPVVYVIDREADSVGHYRDWHKAGRKFLVRADDNRVVLHEGRERKLPGVVKLLRRRKAFKDERAVVLDGRRARLYVAETWVTLHRPARYHRVDRKTGRKEKRVQVAGEPLPLRLVVTEVRDEHTGKVLARWLLVTNLPGAGPPGAGPPGGVDAATVALWYYWRWRIESYHKLLKSAGQEAECWQQETAQAVARRLAVASMAGVVVWNLARDDSPEAEEFRGVLVRLSGRQMKRGRAPDGTPRRPFTEPALMAGLGVLLAALHLLERHDADDLRRMADAALPGLLPRSAQPRRDSG